MDMSGRNGEIHPKIDESKGSERFKKMSTRLGARREPANRWRKKTGAPGAARQAAEGNRNNAQTKQKIERL